VDAAEALVRRGAKVNDLPAAAGMGRLADAKRFLADASAEDRHMAMMLAAQLGHVDVVRLLLDGGEDPNRYNPRGGHAHTTPLHQAALRGHEAVTRLLVERGALLTQRDKIYHATPLGWAVHGEQTAVAEYLRSVGAE
jgi:ankyrin repeat protein